MTVIQNKIKNVINKVKQTLSDNTAEETQTTQNEDDTFDTFIQPWKQKIKQYFSKKQELTKHSQKEQEEQDDDFNIDFGMLKNFFIKHSTLFVLAIVLILQFMPNEGYLPWGGVWMRLQTQNLPMLDDFAQNSVYNFYRNQVANQIIQQYPTLPDEQKNALIDEQLQKTVQENQAVVDEQTRQTAEYLKDSMRYEENGVKYTMMPDIDPYQFLRVARNYLTYGALGDEIRNDVWWDTKVVAPFGFPAQDIVTTDYPPYNASRGVNRELHPYILVYMHKIARFFNPNIPLMQSAAYFPIVFVTLAIAFMFLFIKKLTNTTGGVMAATFLAVASVAVGRTQWGHADTDAYNLFFPTLICWIFAEIIETENKKIKYALSVIIGGIIGLYAFAWTGWWYIFDFLLAAFLIHTIYVAFFNKNKFKESAITTIIYFVSSTIFIDIFKKTSYELIRTALLGPLRFSVIKNAVHSDAIEQLYTEHLFPNVYTTVAELNPTSWSGALNSVGGTLILLICASGLLLLFLNTIIHRRIRSAHATLLLLWLVTTLYATTKGIRFAILIVPAIAALFGICAGIVEQKLQHYNKKKLRLKQILITCAVILAFGFIIIQTRQVEQSYTQSKNDLPIMNKAWWTILTAIKEDSKPNAIINSWWDFGHHFKYIADRAVTFDGAHQNSPMAHWIGRALSTNDEEEAVAILRMLDCGSRHGYDMLFLQLNKDTLKSMKLLKQLIMIKSKEEARKLLQKNNIPDQEKVLKYIYCNPPENYFITSEDMVSKAGVWSHFGLWDFEKSYLWIYIRNKDKNTAINEMKTKLNYTQERAEQTYFELISIKDEGQANSWISPWPGYISGFDICNENDKTIICNNGAMVNKTTMEAFVRIEQGIARPRFLSYIDEKTKEFKTKEYNESTAGISLIIVPTGEKTYRAVLASPEHAKSMFTRLFYFEGHGLKYFKHFKTEHQLIGGGKISVWKIDWEGKEVNVIDAVKNR